MDRTTIAIDPSATRLRRVGRLARRRMRIDGGTLGNGRHTDGTLTVEINGLGSPVAGIPDSFEWGADRPIALVIVHSGIDGEDVAFDVGPRRFGTGRSAAIGDGTGIRYIAFCYDAAPGELSALPAPAASPELSALPAPAASPEPIALPVAAAVASRTPRGVAAATRLAPTDRDRRSILGKMLHGASMRRATT
jgi:hypothetical protein